MKNIFAITVILTLVISCEQNEKREKSTVDKKDVEASVITSNSVDFASIKTDYKKDPVCGMPITAGIKDTLNYKGKVIGFCATECKESFKKNPSSYTLINK